MQVAGYDGMHMVVYHKFSILPKKGQKLTILIIF